MGCGASTQQLQEENERLSAKVEALGAELRQAHEDAKAARLEGLEEGAKAAAEMAIQKAESERKAAQRAADTEKAAQLAVEKVKEEARLEAERLAERQAESARRAREAAAAEEQRLANEREKQRLADEKARKQKELEEQEQKLASPKAKVELMASQMPCTPEGPMILVLGGPGSGKSSLCERLAGPPHRANYISMTALFEKMIQTVSRDATRTHPASMLYPQKCATPTLYPASRLTPGGVRACVLSTWRRRHVRLPTRRRPRRPSWARSSRQRSVAANRYLTQ